MGVSTTTNTERYNGDGTTVAFPFPLYFFRPADVLVYIFDTVAFTIVQKTLGVDFTISGTVNAQGLYPNGGTVTFGVAPTSTEIVVIPRTPVQTQNYNLLQDGTISASALVQQFDYLTLLVQSLQDQLSRCVKLPAGYGPTFSADLPVDMVADYLIGVNSAATGLVVAQNQAGVPGPAGPTGPAGPAGGAGLTVNPITTSTALTAASPVDSQYIPCDATGGAFNVTLPAANLAAVGQVFQIKKTDASGNNVTILPAGSDSILTTVIAASVLLDFRGKSYSFVCRVAGFWDVI